jgi:hypothetical protein
MVDAVERARLTVRTTRALADRLSGTRLRDVLMLEVVTLQAIISRIEANDSLSPTEAAELGCEVDRIMRLVTERAGTDPKDDSPTVH